jgi:hypothetical protein
MKKIVLLACVNTKASSPQPAEKLYISPLFKKTLRYGKSLKPDGMYILSAKHYLLPLNKVIAPYNLTLNDMGADEVRAWSEQIIKMLQAKGYDLDKDHFIFLAGDKYRKYLVPHMTHHSEPLEGLRIGEQMSWLDKQFKKIRESFNNIKNIIYETIKKVTK